VAPSEIRRVVREHLIPSSMWIGQLGAFAAGDTEDHDSAEETEAAHA
jgi:hypothetical protein